MVLAQGLGDELPGTPAVTLTARSPKRLFHLVFESHDGRAPGADSEEKHEPASDIDTVAVDSLKALDPEWPIREADIERTLAPTVRAGWWDRMQFNQLKWTFEARTCHR